MMWIAEQEERELRDEYSAAAAAVALEQLPSNIMLSGVSSVAASAHHAGDTDSEQQCPQEQLELRQQHAVANVTMERMQSDTLFSGVSVAAGTHDVGETVAGHRDQRRQEQRLRTSDRRQRALDAGRPPPAGAVSDAAAEQAQPVRRQSLRLQLKREARALMAVAAAAAAAAAAVAKPQPIRKRRMTVAARSTVGAQAPRRRPSLVPGQPLRL